MKKIALIDSGLYKKTKLNIYKNIRIFFDTQYGVHVDDKKTEDEHGHATIIMKILEKYLKDEKVLNIKILNKNLATHSKLLLKALEIAIDEKVDIINLSLGTISKEYKNEIYKKILKAREKKIIIIASHHNEGEVAYPACFKEVIGIKIKQGNLFEEKLEFDFNNNDIILGGTQRLRWIDGNEYNMHSSSFSTPHITGIILKLINENKKLTLKEILNFINKNRLNLIK
ncbi:S8 family serine peptidase [Haliovirga abyssi]|uniref:Peptidase S8/S53 domain-containing protein n=1 Tax=Haliovirga abyssi TaxID=2996794 RepID=A0AAU9DMG3_9FUSO|nr:S8 family serine peptidase [Haliovirga abyssi]BDU51207.1 hypothetical protein HLVA_17760 [Haliovirga abyssi]